MAVKASHVGLSCKDPIAEERFYTNYFGFERARVLPVGTDQIVMIRCGDFYIELFKAEGDAPVPPVAGDGPHFPGWRHLAFTVDDVDAKLAEMGADARITLGPLGFDDFIPGWRTAWVSDPEGNIVEMSQGYRDEENPPALPEQ